jgi:uncharacterized secreted protein with C-terminal beta-propeller domain
MRGRTTLGLAALATAAVLTGCTTAQEGGISSPEPPPPVGLMSDERRPASESFLVRTASCGEFLSTMRDRALKDVGAYGFGRYGPPSEFATADVAAAAPSTQASAGAAGAGASREAAPKAGVDFSATNVQEAGVDEPDTVKTDGRLLLTTTDGRLRVLDASGGAPKLLSSLTLEGGAGPMFLAGKRAMIFGGHSYGHDQGVPPSDVIITGPDVGSATSATSVTIVDLGDPAQPKVVKKIQLEGGYVDARLVGGVARVVLRSSPDLGFAYPTGVNDIAEVEAANHRVVRTAPASAWLPEGTGCGDAYLTTKPAGYDTITVRSIDPAAAEAGPGVSVTASAQQVYASGSRLFVATADYDSGGPAPSESRGVSAADARSGAGRTAIHAFDITNAEKAVYVGSGDVPGTLLNQFSMSEHDGMLRVATTKHGVSTESRVTVLRTVGKELVETGAVDGLGKTERIYAVRFMGPVGYLVTFRQVDPLYVLDLRDPRKPAVTGELKITGYSAYLHPAGNGRLLGLGQEATEQGRRVGTQLSLFDVSDPTKPSKLAGAVLPGAESEAEHDHHAFLYWPATGLVVVPLTTYSRAQFSGAVAFTASDSSVKEAGRVTHDNDRITRSLVVGDRLITISSGGVQANDLKTLQPVGGAEF